MLAPHPHPHPLTTRHVSVIGAGAAGLVAARELRREGHSVVVFEQGDQVGGTWVYTPKVDSGLSQTSVHSSLFQSLRTNIPRECMGFRDYPFVPKDDQGRDLRRFPGHLEVLMYLQDFTREFEIAELVRFETEVVHVRLEEEKWKIKSRKRGRDDNEKVLELDEIFDAVVVCNGHYTQPRVANILGINEWPGKQMHSHNYRVPEPFRDQVVVLIGNSASAKDISRDIVGVAKEVHIAARSVEDGEYGKRPGYDNMWLHPMIESVCEDATVIFPDGSSVLGDIILHCTGYKYHFPFLETNGIVTVDNNHVEPLYKHIFPPALAPCLSFVGLPSKAIPFPMFELQSKWIAGVLSSRIELPSQEKMMEDVSKQCTLNMEWTQFYYNDWLATQCGCPTSEDWRVQMFYANRENRRVRRDSFRDEWDDHHLIFQAYEDFKKYTLY